MKKVFFKSDWFTGVAIASSVVLLSLATSFNETLENKAYDFGVRLTRAVPSDKIAVIAIDDQSIANLGRWPFPRDLQARMIDRLAQSQPKAIGYGVLLSEAQQDPGLAYINQLSSAYASSALRDATDQSLKKDAAEFERILREADEKLNADRWFATSMQQAGNVVLGMILEPGDVKPDSKLPSALTASEIGIVKAGKNESIKFRASKLTPPLADLTKAANGVGFLAESPSQEDGVVRSHPLLAQYEEHVLPSMALMLAARAMNVAPGAIQVQVGQEVRLGKRSLPIDEASSYRPVFYPNINGKPPFPVDSFFDVYSGKIAPAKYKDKIVLIGGAAKGVGDNLVTPVDAAMPPVMVLAHTLSSMLQGQAYRIPAWHSDAAVGAYLLVALYLILALPRLCAAQAAAISAALALVLASTQLLLMTQHMLWVPLMLPLTLLILGHTALTTKRFLMTEKGKLKSEAESAESNKMLGLAFQGQGQLDMAFEKFRRCPLDEAMMDLLYNLALDFERKRQFNKAHVVFQHMTGFNPKFRDVGERLLRAKAMEETVMLGSATASTLISKDGKVEKPMLGRYSVEKELGKGAMGIVYAGTDPKIGRVVAIKTMALSQEFDADELEEVRKRFFREAETAGKLSHPNIVTIFDAGEEHDLAYIAMELLQGHDLTQHTKPGQLLPLARAMKIIAKVGDALHYAHAQHVVHRDVKPANIMYELDTGAVKVTDFGIARITDSSRTKTGMILGTPAFMSPEQLAGKKIDGRSDIFSLGVTFYQLVTGHLPFKGESVAELMYQIANEQAKPVAAHMPNMPHCIERIIGKMMMKRPEDRYQTGSELARAIAACGQDIAAAMKAKA